MNNEANNTKDATAGLPGSVVGNSAGLNRRRFLEAAGFSISLVALGGCGRTPVETALPLVDHPEGLIPGKTLTYASTCSGCTAACGLLVQARDGRPLKMEGDPAHPLSRGGLCAVGQALPLGLYDDHRLKGPLHNGDPASWDKIDGNIKKQLRAIADSGGAVRFVTPTITSPTLQATIEALFEHYQFADARHVVFDVESCSAILDAHEQTHGARVLPHYKFYEDPAEPDGEPIAARVIVSFGADFLGTWISPVEFTAAWRKLRSPTAEHPVMSYHVQLEGRMSLAGSNADKRYRLLPDEYGIVLSHLAERLAESENKKSPPGHIAESSIPAVELKDLVDHLSNRLLDVQPGQSLVLCDSQNVADQLLVNFINNLLGNYETTVDVKRPSRQRQGSDADVLKLIEELKAGNVAALFVAGTDLTHNLPGREALVAAIGKVPLVVSFAERQDDFASLAHFVCPDHHPLESWLDAEPVDGVISLSQPTVKPLRDTRSILESLACWSERDESAYEILKTTWREKIFFPRAQQQSFRKFWNQAVHDGLVTVPPAKEISVDPFNSEAVRLADERPPQDGLSLVLYSKIGMTDSRHAHNPWLQELPDPVTKITWDNYVCISPALAEEEGLEDGDVVSVAAGGISVELPVLIQPGQHDRVLAMALHYGVRGTDRYFHIGRQWLESRPTVAEGELVGKNVAGFVEPRDGALQYHRGGVTLKKTGRRHDLATTQIYQSLEVPKHIAPRGAEVRDQIQSTTLAAFAKDPLHAGASAHHLPDEQLWPEDHPKDGHAWGMIIDMNACTGCSACLIACQSENNVAVVGKDEVRRQREMHWIRLDRYYSGEGDDVEVQYQPMMCQHCDNAPCETVCPVLATVHSDEGLNEQIYNRCVGTRYCANNCPYKVRRFNWFNNTEWFDYELNGEQDSAEDSSLISLALNPDVTVRSRGVMEKCSMCVQRIEQARIQAGGRGAPIVDGAIQTACQQTCPAQAIVFGDMNDPDSAIHAELANPRRYGVLEEFNFRPTVTYLRVVKNTDERTPGHEAKGGRHE